MAVVRTHKGKTIDMTALKQKNAKTIAVGNMRVNARGDLLGKGGKILKTKEQLTNEKYDKKRTKEVNTTASLNSSAEEMLKGKKKPVKFVEEQAKKKKTDIETLGKFALDNK
jgi:GTP-sensing pleiotropic transcriptional regulator CodY